MGPGSGGTCDKLGHSPNSVVTKNLTVRVKAGCPIGGAHIRVRQIRCYLRYIHSPRDLRSAFRLCIDQLRSRCGAVHIVGLGGHFSWQA